MVARLVWSIVPPSVPTSLFKIADTFGFTVEKKGKFEGGTAVRLVNIGMSALD